MERVVIIGCSGAGKSTLARRLGEKTGLPVVHLDKLWWKPGWVERDRAVFDAKLAEELEKPRWIMDGNFDRTMAMRVAKCDTVIYLDFSRLGCLRGLGERYWKYYGRVRPDMTPGCPEQFDWEFIGWIWNYNKRHRAKNYAKLSQLEGKQVYILKNRCAVKKFLETYCAQR